MAARKQTLDTLQRSEKKGEERYKTTLSIMLNVSLIKYVTDWIEDIGLILESGLREYTWLGKHERFVGGRLLGLPKEVFPLLLEKRQIDRLSSAAKALGIPRSTYVERILVSYARMNYPHEDTAEPTEAGSVGGRSSKGVALRKDNQLGSELANKKKDNLSRSPNKAALEISTAEIPARPPRRWRGKNEELNAKEFVQAVYGDAIRAGMTQADLRRLDRKLYLAFHKWCGRHRIDTRAVLPSSRANPDLVAAQRGGPPSYREALDALRTGTSEGLEVWKAYQSLGRRRRKNSRREP